jgi:zinc finger protein DZIP1
MAAPVMAKPPPPPFRFEVRRARLDWRLLAEVDAERVGRETDIDTLERALDTVCFGDISVEDPRHVSGERHDSGLSVRFERSADLTPRTL